MAKKRGKKSVNSKKIKRAVERADKNSEAQKPAKLDLQELEILSEEKKIEQKVGNIKEKEEEIEKKEADIISEEKKIGKETEEIEKLEKEIKHEVAEKPLTAISVKDINRGIIGAFIGVVAHFAFIYGKEIAKDITALRATFLFIFSYILVIILMYETGYRKIREKRLLKILPKRATAIYLTSLVVVLSIFMLFNQIDVSDPTGLYKQIAVTSVLAALGAGTADLIGRS